MMSLDVCTQEWPLLAETLKKDITQMPQHQHDTIINTTQHNNHSNQYNARTQQQDARPEEHNTTQQYHTTHSQYNVFPTTHTSNIQYILPLNRYAHSS